MIIDIHTHQSEYDGRGERLSPAESATRMLRAMDRAGVSICGLLGSNVSPGKAIEAVRKVNDFTAAVVRENPERFFGLAFTNPALPQADVERELDRCLQMGEFRGIKLELDVNCRDPRVDCVARKGIEYSVPVLHHSWYVNTWNMGEADRKNQQYRSEPHDVAAFARRFPELTIIMAHLEGSGVRGILDIADCPNVRIDTSGSQPFSGTLEYALSVLGRERIVFGSDYCLRGYEGQLGRILGARIDAEDREAILTTNGANLFSLTSSLAYADH